MAPNPIKVEESGRTGSKTRSSAIIKLFVDGSKWRREKEERGDVANEEAARLGDSTLLVDTELESAEDGMKAAVIVQGK